jgi:hypothetical protein
MKFFNNYLIDSFRVGGVFGFTFSSAEKPNLLYRSQAIFSDEESALTAAKQKVLETICDRTLEPCVVLDPIADRIIRVNEAALRLLRSPELSNAQVKIIWINPQP